MLIFIAALITSVGQMFWKLSEAKDVKLIIIGFTCYAIGAVLMVVAFRYGSLSVLHPLMSISYVFAMVLGKTQLKEDITLRQYMAVAIIMIGVTLIGGGDE